MRKFPRILNGVICSMICWQLAAQSAGNLPVIRKQDNQYTLYVDGAPYLILGAQLWNSSAWPIITEQFWPQAAELGCNTIEAPVYWQTLEPRPGQFDFTQMDNLILKAREHHLKLVLLWFGSYKNGRSQYAPDWVLEDTRTYPRMKNAAGQDIYVLSALSRTNLEADKRAFEALMKHLKKMDDRDHTVIMVQVENEPGSMWTDRDYSAHASQLFAGQVPVSLTQALGRSPGSWQAVFGTEAAEAFNAFCISSFIEELATAGKAIYPLPLYTNVWVRENGFERPGEYPSGGPTSNMVPLWKANAPHLDLLALDVYQGNVQVFNSLCDVYDRPDNPLFIPEMGRGPNFTRFQFYALGNYNALGVSPYGIDPFHVDPHDERDHQHLDAKFSGIAQNYALLKKAIFPITQLQGTGNLTAAGEEEGLSEQLVHLRNYDLLLSYGFPTYKEPGLQSGRVLIGQIGEDEFLLIGFDVKFAFRPSFGSGFEEVEYLMAEQGHYEGEQWVRERVWNGDALYHATLPADGVVLRIRLRRVRTITGRPEKANFDQ